MVDEVQGPTTPAFSAFSAFSQNYNSFRKAQTQAPFALSSPDPQQGSITEKNDRDVVAWQRLINGVWVRMRVGEKTEQMPT